MAHHVFISYATPDRSIAEAACGYLEKRQIRCWMAPRDILPGTDYTESIHRAIDESRTMVLVFSSHAARSPHVLREIEAAVKRNLTIIPFRVEAVEPSGAMQYYLGASHWLDAFPPPVDDHLHRLTESVEELVPAVCAGRMNRVKASLIDLLIVILLGVFLHVGVWLIGPDLMGTTQFTTFMQNPLGRNIIVGDFLLGIGFIVTIFLYFFLLDQSWLGSSIGKLAMGMIVVNEKKETAPRRTLLLRDTVKCASASCLCIPYILDIAFPPGLWYALPATMGFILLHLPVFLTRKQQALHDRVAGTLVVKKRG